MWARVVELLLGGWLIITPFVFRGTPNVADYVALGMICGSLVVVFSLVSYWPPLRRAHLGTLVVGFVLAGHGYFSAVRPGPPAAQNEIVLGLLLLIFAIVPTEASKPPDSWRARANDVRDV